VVLAAGQQSEITLVVALGRDAPVSAQAFFEATGGGAIQAAQIDENNDYNVLANGGSYVDPTYIAAGG